MYTLYGHAKTNESRPKTVQNNTLIKIKYAKGLGEIFSSGFKKRKKKRNQVRFEPMISKQRVSLGC